jgi:hypothetical protein
MLANRPDEFYDKAFFDGLSGSALPEFRQFGKIGR